ncbi:MAG TPA: ribonuclease Y [Solirubrobacterales bacterium]|nr:ribonuclease Y [Solirubrobacterales bacterium]
MKFSMPSWTLSRGNGSEPDLVLDRLEALDAQLNELERRRISLDARERDLDRRAGVLQEGESQQRDELERVASLSAVEARQALLRQVETDARRQAGLALRRIEEETRLEAERRARGILATATQRLAGPHAVRTTTQLVHLPNDEMKGRIIGREGRNIQALEQLTGVDIIVDDTPSAVRLSSFDGMRREVARLTLERLIADGRIHPARCEEAFEQATGEIEDRIVEEGERATLDANINGLHPQLIDLLGKLQFRTSYGQNVLTHLVECSYLATLIALELGAAGDIARRAALLHDIGKAVDQDVEGTHARVGARLARRYGESEAVVHAIEAHHDEVEPRTVEAVIVQAADALSGARPGARGATLENYVARLHDLEALASSHAGVEKVYAMQAGREVRVMVDPGEVDDERAALISHEIATAIEREISYPGRIKITVIRESRATNYAR